MDLSTLSPAELTVMGSVFCVLLTLHFTSQLISQHLFYWKNPREQKAIMIIILMPSVYAVNSFVGLLDVKGSKPFFMFLDAIKECYEALVIAKFLALMYSYLNISITAQIIPDEIKGREIHHSFPMTLFVVCYIEFLYPLSVLVIGSFLMIVLPLLQPRITHLDHRTLQQLKQWTWQFCVVRPTCSILMITLQILGVYPTWLSWVFTIILNVSVSLALYSLVKFYHVFAKELEPHKPLSKFMCIKGIVFFCFWQGVVLKILVGLGLIKSHHFWLKVEQLEEALQNVLVCLEMIVFSVIQQYAFHVAPYSGDTEAKMRMTRKD